MSIAKKLKAPFVIKDIEWRVQQAGWSKRNGVEMPWAMVLAYVDARAVMDRLDEVVGAANWYDEYEHQEGGVLCKLSIKLGDEWITKVDGSPETAVEAFKGGISKALVRAAVKWGIGRYLYDLTSNFAETSMDKRDGWRRHYDKKTNRSFFWSPPTMPAWALPAANESDYGELLLGKLRELTGSFQDKKTLQTLLKKLNVASSKEIQEAPANIQRSWYQELERLQE